MSRIFAILQAREEIVTWKRSKALERNQNPLNIVGNKKGENPATIDTLESFRCPSKGEWLSSHIYICITPVILM